VILRMIVDSRPGELDLLATLPHDLPRGAVHGLRAHGRVSIPALSWTPGEVQLTVSCARDSELLVRVFGTAQPGGMAPAPHETGVRLEAGATRTLRLARPTGSRPPATEGRI
jgi:hypothetical protein